MLAACCHTLVLSGWYEPERKARVPRHQMRDRGYVPSVQESGQPVRAEAGRGAFPRLPGAEGPCLAAPPLANLTQLPPEAGSAWLVCNTPMDFSVFPEIRSSSVCL